MVATSAALPERLRLETRTLHAATERSGAMAALLAGRLPRAGYVAMLRNLHALYVALESALLAHAGAVAVAALQAGSLGRAAPLADDLATLHGPAWADELPVTAAALHYVARLQAFQTAGVRIGTEMRDPTTLALSPLPAVVRADVESG